MRRADVPKLSFDFTVLLPRLNFTGTYSLQIKLLLLDLKGMGEVKGSFSKWNRLCVRFESLWCLTDPLPNHHPL